VLEEAHIGQLANRAGLHRGLSAQEVGAVVVDTVPGVGGSAHTDPEVVLVEVDTAGGVLSVAVSVEDLYHNRRALPVQDTIVEVLDT
jgi:hypothetical protein